MKIGNVTVEGGPNAQWYFATFVITFFSWRAGLIWIAFWLLAAVVTIACLYYKARKSGIKEELHIG